MMIHWTIALSWFKRKRIIRHVLARLRSRESYCSEGQWALGAEIPVSGTITKFASCTFTINCNCAHVYQPISWSESVSRCRRMFDFDGLNADTENRINSWSDEVIKRRGWSSHFLNMLIFDVYLSIFIFSIKNNTNFKK